MSLLLALSFLMSYFKPFSVGAGVDLECMGRPFTLEDPGAPGVAEEVECPGVVNFSSLDRLKILVKRILLTNHVHYYRSTRIEIECLCTNKPRFNSIQALNTPRILNVEKPIYHHTGRKENIHMVIYKQAILKIKSCWSSKPDARAGEGEIGRVSRLKLELEKE